MPLIASCRGVRRASWAVAGLTLIELMVVIAIVAVLATLLMVSIPMVRARSELAVCTSNLRSIGQGIHLYAADHDGEAPAGSEITAYINWYHLLEPYMGAMETDSEYGECWGLAAVYDKGHPDSDTRRHNGSGNYLMVDGSVRFYTTQMLMEALPDVYKKIEPIH